MPKKRFTEFLPTQSLKIVDRKTHCNEQHIRITRSMIYSEAFMSLNAVALKLYDVLRLKFHNEEKNNTDFAFSKSLGVKLLQLSSNSEKSIRKGLQELVQKGFIEQTFISSGGGKNNKIPNRYKFSANWKNYKREYSKDKRYKNCKQ